MDVLQPLGIATLDLMKGVQNDVEYGETMGDCAYSVVVCFCVDFIVVICIDNNCELTEFLQLHFSRHGWVDCGSGYDVEVLQETQV